MAVWRDGFTGALEEKAVDMTLRLDKGLSEILCDRSYG